MRTKFHGMTLYIADPEATQGGKKPCVYALESAPDEVFDAWLDHILAVESIRDSLLLFMIKAHRREDWDTVSRWWLTTALTLYGVDMRKYYFRNEEDQWLL